MAGNRSNERRYKQGMPERRQEVQPIVSVIIPAYGCEKTIDRAIRSVLEQDVPLELIVVNDCSPDELNTVMKKYRSNPVLCYVQNSKNLGASGSRNRGISLARGKYIAFLDADDWWAKGKLARQITLLEEKKGVLCSTGRQLMDSKGKDSGRYIGVPKEFTYRMLLHQNFINCSSVVWRKDVAEEFPMEHEDSHEDYITWIKVLKKYKKAYGIDEPLLYYCLSSEGKSGNKLHSAGMTYKVYRYVGFGRLRSFYYFCWYAFHGVRKYFA